MLQTQEDRFLLLSPQTAKSVTKVTVLVTHLGVFLGEIKLILMKKTQPTKHT